MRRFKSFWLKATITLIALIALAYFAAHIYLDQKLESLVADSLQDSVGRADYYDVTITASPINLIYGEIPTVRVFGKNVQISENATFKWVDITLYNVIYDYKKQKVTGARYATCEITATEEQLSHYLKKSFPKVPNLQVGLEEGTLHISTTPKLGGLFGVNIHARCALQIEGSQLLNLDIKKVDVEGLGVPGIARDYIKRELNPIFDASKWDLGIEFISTEITKDEIVLTGSADVGKVLRKL